MFRLIPVLLMAAIMSVAAPTAVFASARPPVTTPTVAVPVPRVEYVALQNVFAPVVIAVDTATHDEQVAVDADYTKLKNAMGAAAQSQANGNRAVFNENALLVHSLSKKLCDVLTGC